MSSHRRTTSDSISSTYVFQPHPLSFAGDNEESDNYFAAQRYDWNQVPSKLTEPRVPYDPTQPFDYVLQRKGKNKTLSVRNEADAEEGIVRRKAGRPRREAQENHSPAVSVEPDAERHGPKRRGRPPRRAADTSRKTDDGDNSEDESYVQPDDSWRAGTKRRGPAPHHPPKRARTSKTAESDDDQEAGPLRSGGARSRATPIKPQQANRWSATEDRQLIDSLFEVLGSIPWRRVTGYMAEKGYSCADRGEGAIRGRWKVLRPRLYIAPPTVVRGAAAKSQLKARERAAEAGVEEELDEMDADTTKETEHDDDHLEQEEHDHPEPRRHEHAEVEEQQRPDTRPEPERTAVTAEAESGTGGGDTTAEDDDVAIREEEARGRERKRRKVVPLLPPPLVAPVVDLTAVGPPTPPSIPPPAPGLSSIPVPPAPAPTTAPTRPTAQNPTPGSPVPPRSPPPPFQHSTPNMPREPKAYLSKSPFAASLEHFSLSPGKDPNHSMQPLSVRDQIPLPSTRDHNSLSPNRGHLLLSPHRDPRQLSPNREPQGSPQSTHKLPTLSQILSPPPVVHYPPHSPPIGQYTSHSPPAGHFTSHSPNHPLPPHSPTRIPPPHSPTHLPSSHSPTHLPLPLSHQHAGPDTRQLPPPEPFVPHSHTVWPARPSERTYQGERSYERVGGSRDYQVSGERGSGYTRGPYAERPFVSPARDEPGYERATPTKTRKPLPEMLPFSLPTRQQSAPYQAYSTQVFNRLSGIGERTSSSKRKKKNGNSQGEEVVVPDSVAESGDAL